MKWNGCIAPLAALLLAGSRAPAAVSNLGGSEPVALSANSITAQAGQSVGAILYAPSDGDDPAFRAALAAETGGIVDYFNAAAGTPDAELLQGYQCVFTWANNAYANPTAFGDQLADYVDAGGNVVLGAFCTATDVNALAGRIMTPGYAPVYSPNGENLGTLSAYSGDGVGRLYSGVEDFACVYRDDLALQGAGVQNGSYEDSSIACAFRPDYKVVYANGQGGGEATCSGDSPRLIANACAAGSRGRFVAPAPASSWSWVAALLVLIPVVELRRVRQSG